MEDLHFIQGQTTLSIEEITSRYINKSMIKNKLCPLDITSWLHHMGNLGKLHFW